MQDSGPRGPGLDTPVLERPDFLQPDVLAQDFPEVFPVCAVTRAQAHIRDGAVDLSDTLFAAALSGQPVSPPVFSRATAEPSVQAGVECDTPIPEAIRLPIGRDSLIEAQKEDGSLAKCFAAALAPEGAKNTAAAYFMEHGLLMRRWRPHAGSEN